LCVDGTGGGRLKEVQGDGGLAGGEGQGQAGLHAFSHMIMKFLVFIFDILTLSNKRQKALTFVRACKNALSFKVLCSTNRIFVLGHFEYIVFSMQPFSVKS
jgi:hypothetical protein